MNDASASTLRRAAVAGSWYPAAPEQLAREVDRYLAAAAAATDVAVDGDVLALIAPHAGLMYSGPIAAYAYRLLAERAVDVAILVGPSHFVGFDGVALYAAGAFETPFGPCAISSRHASALAAHSAVMKEVPAAHAREHSLEMQLPFLKRVSPNASIVPLVMGYQTPDTVRSLADALAASLRGQRVLLIASTDLSHYHDARTASRLDARVIECVETFDPEGLLAALEECPEHACGGGPTVAVMMAARALGARDARVLKYGDSGDVSGDKDSVVGYLAAALGSFTSEP